MTIKEGELIIIFFRFPLIRKKVETDTNEPSFNL